MFGRLAPVSVVQQNQICGQFQRQRDSFGLTGVESRCKQSRDLALPECLRLDPVVLESLLDLLKGCCVRHLIEFRLDSDRNPDLAKLASEKIQPANYSKVSKSARCYSLRA